ncbi:MAG: TetR family transcriptional regulator [Betaproteobacteria bacterium]|nr:TetR family transcriptional regulator [Betaproteobacteria bacterium]
MPAHPAAGKRARPAGARSRAPRRSAPAHVESLVSDPRLVEERRAQIVRAAVKLFSERGYYTTTIQQVAREAGISTGLVYQYFRDKDDLLLLALMQVLERYEQEIPRRLEGVEAPVERLCTALRTYCGIVDRMRDATVLTYRSTKSLRADRRALIMEGERRTNRLLERCIHACVAGGDMRAVNEHLLAYSYVMFCHAWALKHWALRDRYSLEQYVREGFALLVEPFLTAQGRAAYAGALRGPAGGRSGAAKAK